MTFQATLFGDEGSHVTQIHFTVLSLEAQFASSPRPKSASALLSQSSGAFSGRMGFRLVKWAVVLALLQKYNIREAFRIIDCNGIDPLLKSLPVRLKSADVDKIAINMDADQHISSRWNEIEKMLKPLVEYFPEAPQPEGTLLKTFNNQEIMIWLMPNNDINGTLEDFITF